MEQQTVEKPAEIQSDFGRGLTYCLGLFLAHTERLTTTLAQYEKMAKKNPELFTEESAVEIWFNGAADHLFELKTEYAPAPAMLQGRLETLKTKCLHWRLAINRDAATLKDARWAIQEAKDLLRLIDESHGVPVCKGQYE